MENKTRSFVLFCFYQVHVKEMEKEMLRTMLRVTRMIPNTLPAEKLVRVGQDENKDMPL